MAINTRPNIHELVICANCFIRKDNKYLVLRRSKNKKYAPGVIHPVGGKVEPGENPYEAAIREVTEETGVEVDNLRLEAVLLEMEPHLNEPWDWIIFHFSADYIKGDPKKTVEGELIWLSGVEIRNEQLFPSLRLVIDDILDESRGTAFATIEYDKKKQKIIKHSLKFATI